MFLKNAVILTLVIAIAFVAGCGRKTVYPDSPASATGTTDAEGIAAIDVGPFKVNIKVVNVYEQPLAGMTATAYLLKGYLMAVASSPANTYYANLTILTYEDAQSRRKPVVNTETEESSSTQSSATREVDITVTLTNAGLSAYGYDVAVANLDALQTDEWVTPAAQDYDMNGLYGLSDSVDYSGGAIVHLTPEVSNSIGAGRQTASFLINTISDLPTFASLMSFELRVFDGDTIHTQILDFQDNPLPVLVIDDIGMNRNFFMQFTLTWGENPGDLDSHLWTPNIEGSVYHVYYASRGNSAAAPYVDLDVDDVTSYGPEHITIYDEFPGTYIYAIYHYSGTGDISTSGAAAGILWPDGSVQNFTVPSASASANWWWHVCTIDGTTGVITPVNSVSADPPSGLAMPPLPLKVEID